MRIKVEKWVHGANGLGRLPDGKVIFIPNGIPGDLFQIDHIKKNKGVFWAEQSSLIQPSSARLEKARCPHFESCGGCSILQVSEDTESNWKQGIVEDCLRRIAKVDPEMSFTSFELAGSRHRGRFRIEPGMPPGFSLRASHQISSIEDCKVLARAIQEDLPELGRYFSQEQFRGFLYFSADQNHNWIGAFEGKGKLKLKTPYLKGLDQNAYIQFDWLGFSPKLSAFSFFQSNPVSWPTFWDQVRRFIREFNLQHVWDVHAGSGFLSVAVESDKLWVTEPDQHASSNLKRLAQQKTSMRVVNETAEQALKKNIIPFSKLDGLILDPPRSGLSSSLRRQIVDCGPAHILYISCDIASFSRDLRDLSQVYEMHWPLSIWNVNPGTARAETALTLSRRPNRR